MCVCVCECGVAVGESCGFNTSKEGGRVLFHIIHILILTLDPNPNPKLKKKKKNQFFPIQKLDFIRT